MNSNIVGPNGEPISTKDVNSKTGVQEKSKLMIAVISAIGGLLLGSGGVFGFVKWLDNREIELLRAQYEIAKTQAELADKYLNQRDILEKKIVELEAAGDPNQSSENIKKELIIINENLEYLISRNDLPGWAQEKVKVAREAVTRTNICIKIVPIKSLGWTSGHKTNFCISKGYTGVHDPYMSYNTGGFCFIGEPEACIPEIHKTMF